MCNGGRSCWCKHTDGNGLGDFAGNSHATRYRRNIYKRAVTDTRYEEHVACVCCFAPHGDSHVRLLLLLFCNVHVCRRVGLSETTSRTADTEVFFSLVLPWVSRTYFW